MSAVPWPAPARASAPRPSRAWRHQLPAYSPLSAGALLDGLRAIAHPTRSHQAAERLIALLRERYAPRAVLLTDSGTGALTGALAGLRRERPGLRAALPAFSCYDVATAAAGADVPVLLYDTDPHALGPDLSSVRRALGQGAGAIVVSHLFGYPVDLREVNRLAAETGAVVIEDAAQAAGATLDTRPAGGQSSLAVFSFGRGKGLTGGAGGALLAYDAAGEQVVERVRELLRPPRRGWRELGALAGQLLLVRLNLYAVAAAVPFLRLGETIYREPRPVGGASPLSSAVVAATWREAERELRVRRRHAERLLLALERQPELEPIAPLPGARPGYLRLPVLASAGARRAAATSAARRLGIMPSYPQALVDLAPLVPRCANRADPFPGSRLLAARLCTLPTHGRLDSRDLTCLEQWIRAVGGR